MDYADLVNKEKDQKDFRVWVNTHLNNDQYKKEHKGILYSDETLQVFRNIEEMLSTKHSVKKALYFSVVFLIGLICLMYLQPLLSSFGDEAPKRLLIFMNMMNWVFIVISSLVIAFSLFGLRSIHHSKKYLISLMVKDESKECEVSDG